MTRPALDHLFDVQVFHRDPAEPFHEAPRKFERVVLPLVSDFRPGSGEEFALPSATI
jgi:hypothetical protein